MSLVREVVSVFHSLLSSDQGISRAWAAGQQALEVGLPRVAADQIVTHQMPAQLLSQQGGVRYPRFQVYCDHVENQMREKFNRFSGTAQLTVEVHHSQERWENLAAILGIYVQAVTDIIESHRGELNGGVYLTGRYVVDVDAPKTGGRGFIQSARISVPVEMIRA